MKVRNIYICDYCEREYFTQKEAEDCELVCENIIKEFKSIKVEFYKELGKIQKFDNLLDRVEFLKRKKVKLRSISKKADRYFFKNTCMYDCINMTERLTNLCNKINRLDRRVNETRN